MDCHRQLSSLLVSLTELKQILYLNLQNVIGLGMERQHMITSLNKEFLAQNPYLMSALCGASGDR